jgi:hypothetical protein
MELQYSDLTKLSIADDDLIVIRSADIKPSDVSSLIRELKRIYPTWKGHFIVLPPDTLLSKIPYADLVKLRDDLNSIID